MTSMTPLKWAMERFANSYLTYKNWVCMNQLQYHLLTIQASEHTMGHLANIFLALAVVCLVRTNIYFQYLKEIKFKIENEFLQDWHYMVILWK